MKFLKKHARRLTQVITAVLYNCNITGFARGRIYTGSLKGVCVPGLNCYSCPGAVGACPLGSLQSALVSSKHGFPYYVLGLLILFGVVFGRFICGFLCPFGLLQELLYKIPGRKIKKGRVTAALSFLKYIILAVFCVAVPLLIFEPGFCKYICPAGTLEGGIFLSAANPSVRAMLGRLFSLKTLILIVIAVLSVFCYRVFCRFLCPLGALYSLFNRFSFFRMSVDESKCTRCGKCLKVCKTDIKKVGDRECVHCGECAKCCECIQCTMHNA
ncbi:MAG: 4Fe-4S binding protein [Clostridiales bacterium]|nr:4Fe-4S binding protein [Clostridiales bacterium]